MTWTIVCDSSCDLTSAELIPGRLSLQVVPMTITVGARDYRDDETLDPARMLQHMEEESGPTSTACPTPQAFAEAFAQADCSLCFTISQNLSGTYNAAVAGREMALEQHPEKRIFLLDSRSTAGALVLLTRKARALLEGGEERFEAVCRVLEEYQKSLRTVFTLESFHNLIKNGRMRPLLGTVLHTLGIHVIAAGSREGTIQVVDKARGQLRTFRAILTQMEKEKDCQQAEVMIAHCENPEGATALRDLIRRRLPVKSVTVLPCRGLTSYYAERKGLIVVF